MQDMTPTQQLTAEVLTWPRTTARIGDRDEYGFYVDDRQLGHLHGDRVAHFGFPREVGQELRDAGRGEPPPLNRHPPKRAARPISGEADVEDVLALLRLNYEREVAAYGGEPSVHDAV